MRCLILDYCLCSLLRKCCMIYSNLPLKFATWIYPAFANLTGRCELNNLCSNQELLIEMFCKHHVCQWITTQFDDVFCPEVKKRTGRAVDQLFYCWTMLQAIFPLLKEVTLKWCSLTKLYQPCDIKIIAALKKYLYLSHVLDFYELGNTLKAHKKEQANRLPQGAARVAYGNPVHCRNCGNLRGNWRSLHTISGTNKDNVNFLWVWKHVRKSPWSTRSLLSPEVQFK